LTAEVIDVHRLVGQQREQPSLFVVGRDHGFDLELTNRRGEIELGEDEGLTAETPRWPMPWNWCIAAVSRVGMRRKRVYGANAASRKRTDPTKSRRPQLAPPLADEPVASGRSAIRRTSGKCEHFTILLQRKVRGDESPRAFLRLYDDRTKG